MPFDVSFNFKFTKQWSPPKEENQTGGSRLTIKLFKAKLKSWLISEEDDTLEHNTTYSIQVHLHDADPILRTPREFY